jgi:hypothetical protein
MPILASIAAMWVSTPSVGPTGTRADLVNVRRFRQTFARLQALSGCPVFAKSAST